MRILYSQAYPSRRRVPPDIARRGTKIETLPEEPGNSMTDEVVTLIGPFDQTSQHAPELQRSSSSADRWMRSGSPLPPPLRGPSASSSARLQHPKHRRFWAVLRVAQGRDRPTSSILRGRFRTRKPVDPAGPVENAKNAFPTGPWAAHTTRRPQGSTRLCCIPPHRTKTGPEGRQENRGGLAPTGRTPTGDS